MLLLTSILPMKIQIASLSSTARWPQSRCVFHTASRKFAAGTVMPIATTSSPAVTVTKHKPSDALRWDRLADEIGSLVQSTRYDDVQAMFGHYPVYVELTDGGVLVSGVKLYEYVSKKIPPLAPLSKHIFQLGEILLEKNADANVVQRLRQQAEDYVVTSGATHFSVSGYYGNADLLLDPPGSVLSHKLFNVAVVDLKLDPEALYANLNDSHKRNIKKAEKHKLSFVREDNFDAFDALVRETYDVQGLHGPQKRYLIRLYDLLKNNHAELFFVKDGEMYLSTAMITRTGRYAHYAFGGNTRNNFGSGPYLHWSLIRHYKELGFDYYNFGQVAVGDDPDNVKFAEGITRFKKSFGGFELSSFSKKIILSPFKYRLWETILKLTGKK
jgi:hypothetical protein